MTPVERNIALPAPPSAGQIEQAQLDRLRALLGYLRRSRSYYTLLLEQAGLDGDVAGLDEFTARMPLTTKADLVADQRLHPPFGSNLPASRGLYQHYHQTSGTTSEPMRWLDTQRSWQAMIGVWQQIYDAADVRGDDRVLLAFSFGPFIGFWLAHAAAEQRGCLAFTTGGMTSNARVELIYEARATVLCCTPTYALRLGQIAAERYDPKRNPVRRIIVAGEPGGSVGATRQRIEAIWPGALVFDHHGMTEVGPASYQCPEHPGTLHVAEPQFITEVIDPQTGQPVERRQSGELVLTTLHRLDSPVLRLRTGDIVQASTREVCDCGRAQTALEGGIIGRADDMVVVRGVNVFPSVIDGLVRQYSAINEYRVIVDRKDNLAELTVEVELNPDRADPEAPTRLHEALRDRLSLRIDVRAVEAGSLPRFDMKAKRWVQKAE